MAKKPMISNDELRKLLQNYFIDECMGDPALIKMRAASVYIQKHGYPKYQYESLRKNPAAKEYFEKVRAEGINADIQTLASYTTLDVSAFLERNDTRPKLISALTKLDGYYHDVAVTAMKFYEENARIKDLISGAHAATAKAKAEAEQYKEELARVKAELRSTKESLAVVNDYVDSVIYDGCARQILEERGILVQKNEDAIEVPKENFKNAIIRSDMDIMEVLKAGFEEE